MGAFAYAQCMLLTLLGAYPFVAILLKENPSSDFIGCSESGQCIFTRFFGSPGVPATSLRNVELSTDDAPGSGSFGEKLVLTFVSVQNGQKLGAVSPAWSFTTWPALVYHLMVEVLSVGFRGEGKFPSPEHVTHEYCSDPAVRDQLENSLKQGISRLVYLVGVIGWAILKIAHDWALLSGVPEQVTLAIGIASWVSQSLACTASFIWSAGAIGIFISMPKEKGLEHAACYYQLEDSEVLVTLIPPFLLLVATIMKRSSLYLSIVHGDYLYAVAYDVPFRVVRSTAPSHPTGSLLTVGLHGDPDLPSAPHPELSFQAMDRLAFWLKAASWPFSISIWGIVGIAVGPLFRRLIAVTIATEWSFKLLGAIKFSTTVASCAPLVMSVYLAVKTVKAHSGSCLRLVVSDRLWFALSGILSTVHLAPVLLGQQCNPLDESWLWSCHGMTLALLGLFSMGHLLAPTFVLRELRRLTAASSMPTMELERLSSYEMERVKAYPEWKLQAHVRFVKSSPIESCQVLRSKMLESTAEVSHVQLAQTCAELYRYDEAASDEAASDETASDETASGKPEAP